jgi:hypothetical protein
MDTVTIMELLTFVSAAVVTVGAIALVVWLLVQLLER